MRAVFGLVLIAGIGLAGFAAYMVKERLDAYEAELAKARAAQAQIVDTVKVFVAADQLKYGQRLEKEAVRVVRWPKNALPEGVFTDAAALFPEDAEPRTILRTMEKNEPVLAVKVTEPGRDAGITSRLKRGMRAFAINVDVSSGVSGFLRPGDRVDVYWTGSVGRQTVGGEGRGEITKLIQTGVRADRRGPERQRRTPRRQHRAHRHRRRETRPGRGAGAGAKHRQAVAGAGGRER